MSLSENDQENVFARHFQQQSKLKAKKPAKQENIPEQPNNDVSHSVSWPIILAIIPAFGAFFAGSAEIWSDFVMLLLILYYVYKWMTVPWSYYESARSRRILHQNSSAERTKAGLLQKEDEKRFELERQRRRLITAELRRHELAGLIWVVLSPAIAGYTLQYSRFLLSNVDKYISTFNVTVFIMAASIKPLSHVMTLLQERTLYLQSEAGVTESQIQILQAKVDLLEKELYSLRKAFATKKDLGQISEDINPTLQQLSKALKRFEKRDVALRSWSEEQFTSIDMKIREFDQFICYRIEQDQRQQAHGMVVSLILLPLNVSLWAVKRMTTHGKNLLTFVPNNSTSPPSSVKSKQQQKSMLRSNKLSTNIQDFTESSYSTEGSIAAFGH